MSGEDKNEKISHNESPHFSAFLAAFIGVHRRPIRFSLCTATAKTTTDNWLRCAPG